MRFLCIVLAALFAAPISAAAATTAAAPTPSQLFGAVILNPGHRATVLDAARQTPSWAHLNCAGASFLPAREIAVYIPVQFSTQSVPIAGEWREGITATGCGVTMMLNVLTGVSAPGTLATGPLQPGTTIADPELQNAAQHQAVQAAGGIPPGCNDAYVADTLFVAYDGKVDKSLPPIAQSAPWHEAWTLDFCGIRKTVTLHFTPGPDGVTIDTDKPG